MIGPCFAHLVCERCGPLAILGVGVGAMAMGLEKHILLNFGLTTIDLNPNHSAKRTENHEEPIPKSQMLRSPLRILSSYLRPTGFPKTPKPLDQDHTKETPER